ncbi:MAG TPA: RluA family pseudouridine synthase, partial [Paenibacillaceae bacterium]|nr:RluA family pseudouridine synthase [Paenibacillaceae bacterium]
MKAIWKMDDQWLEYTAVEDDSGLLLEQVLKERLHISGRMIQRLTRNKGLFLNRKAPFLKKKVKNGDRIKVRIGDGTKEPHLPPIPLSLDLLFEDDALMVLNKQAGLMVHPVKEGQNHTLAHGIAFYRLQKGKSGFVRPVHRLDKETSGAILFAGNGYIHRLLDQQLQEGTIKRSYYAVVAGHLGEPGEKGTINAPIARD